jgi:(4S)-4-hydroxy-5-phosphonooxypentane-2,3-dione isomerase
LFAITVVVRVKPDRREEFLSAIGRQGDASRELEPGCLRFELLESRDDPLEFLIFEVYDTPDDYHSAHRETPHYAEWTQVAAEVLEGERVVTGYTPVRLELETD